MSDHHQKIIDKVLCTNFFGGHSESLLLAMFCDPNKRGKAIELIKQIRSAKRSDLPVRPFTRPDFKFDQITSESTCDDYDKLLDFTAVEQLHEPPVLMGVEDKDLEHHQIGDYPCHTQAVERCIQLISQVSQKVTGPERRTGYAMNTLFSRTTTGSVSTKSLYEPVNPDLVKRK